MMGLVGAITPAGSGKIMIVITGDTDNDTAADGTKMGIRYGTGSAPTNGAALTGTAVGTLPNAVNANLALDVNRYPFAVSAVVTGLSVGIAYWVDLSLAAVTGGVARVRNISIAIQEIGSGATGSTGVTGSTGPTGATGPSSSAINTQSTTYTTVLGDAGKTIVTTGTFTVTIDSNANVAYPTGTMLSFVNTSGTLSIAITSDTLNRGDGTSGTGTRTLAASSCATAIKTASTVWWINGRFAS
jgi:hypothetical protein